MEILTKIKSIIYKFRVLGLTYISLKIKHVFIVKKLPFSDELNHLLEGKTGIEIGGPSPIFSDTGFVPIYKNIKQLDTFNYSNKTIWEGEIFDQNNFEFYENKYGKQFIAEATHLKGVKDESLDFILSSHCLEHVANPFKAIEEWLRVLKVNGIVVLILPQKKCCFDHKRPYTNFIHLLEDFENNIDEYDTTHYNEIISLHDLKLDFLAGSRNEFIERCQKNFENRGMHHHVFSLSLLEKIFTHFGIHILYSYEGMELIIIGSKSK
jgi:SAM-dependent methyltransferase